MRKQKALIESPVDNTTVTEKRSGCTKWSRPTVGRSDQMILRSGVEVLSRALAFRLLVSYCFHFLRFYGLWCCVFCFDVMFPMFIWKHEFVWLHAQTFW